MLIGIFICSPLSALMAVIGSIVSILTSMGLGAPQDPMYRGLWGFSAVLTALALGGAIIKMRNPACFIYMILGVIVTVVIHGATVGFMGPFGIPAFTFPFNLASWIFCLGSKCIPVLDIDG